MKYYAGLDVSLKETSVCIVNQDGDILKEGKVPADPEPLAAFLKATGLVFDRVGLEAGPGSPWLYKGLAAAGLPVFCIETRHAHAALKAQNVKTDRNDARGIAHMMRTGWFKATHVKASESQKRRVLLNNRKSLAEKRLDIENQIRGTLKVFGLKVGRVTAAQYEPRIRELIADDAELQAYIEPLLEVRRHVAGQCRRLEKMILDMVKQDAVCRRFMTIPGVGPLTALLFKTSIDDPHRFRKSANVGVHLGLTPRKYASGEVDYDGRITKCGDSLTRVHLYEAAQVLMTRVRKWSTLKAWGMRVARRSSMKNACVAVARKLAVIMHRMWIEGTDFRYGKEVAA
jgi:transposase